MEGGSAVWVLGMERERKGLEPVVRGGGGKAGTGGVDFGYVERERKGAGRGRERRGAEEDERERKKNLIVGD